MGSCGVRSGFTLGDGPSAVCPLPSCQACPASVHMQGVGQRAGQPPGTLPWPQAWLMGLVLTAALSLLVGGLRRLFAQMSSSGFIFSSLIKQL